MYMNVKINKIYNTALLEINYWLICFSATEVKFV